MKLNHWILIIILVVILAFGIKVYAGSLEMVSYYPPAKGFFDVFKVTKALQIPCTAPTVSKPGSAWLNDS